DKVVAHCATHRLHLRNVCPDGPIVQAQLDGMPTLSTSRQSILRTLLTGAQLDTARIAKYAIAVAAPQAVQRLPAGFADDVPESNLHAPAGVGAAEHARVLLQVERIRPEQLGFDPALEHWRAGVARRTPA